MLCLSVAALGLAFFSLNTSAVPLASPEAIASLVANLPADHAAGLASLMARGADPSTLESLMDKRQTSQMSAIIDSYIVNLEQAGFVPNANANATAYKRDTLNLESLIEKRSIPSVPLVIDLLAQHGFVPTTGSSGATSKRGIPDIGSALGKRTLPDLNLVIDRLAAHGFVPSSNSTNLSIAKRDATGDINTIISQLEAYGFNPNDFMQRNFSAQGNFSTLSSANSSINQYNLTQGSSSAMPSTTLIT